jgi:hypothetical protein
VASQNKFLQIHGEPYTQHLLGFSKIYQKTLDPSEAVGSILAIFTHGMSVNPDKTIKQKIKIYKFIASPTLIISLVFPKNTKNIAP